MRAPLLSSAEVAALLGVSAASVKRWADAGVLPCVRTTGQHRRFAREAIDELRQAQAAAARAAAAGAGEPTPLLDELLGGGEVALVEGELLRLRAAHGAWWRVAAALGPTLDELGRRWRRRQLGVAEEHRASERLARALARLCEWMPLAPGAPACLLATATGDEHTLGLSLVELCLRERGWAALWVGRSAPAAAVADAVGRYEVRLVALSASSWSRRARALVAQIEAVGRACAPRAVPLVLGGSGAWPTPPRYGRVIRDFASFGELVSTLTPV